jgi:hypothetical protein
LCLPKQLCVMNRREVLTELGPDAGALRDQDREAILFDLGLAAWQSDLCLRVSDPNVVAQLRVHAGRGVFEPGNPAMSVVLASSPHRVFVSRLGRIEVFGPIPSPNGKSPEGPHTHVLPKLLSHRRTHSATEQIPEGWIPCAHLYPAHPAKDGLGHSRPFDSGCHDAFQKILGTFGNPDFMALKQRVLAAVAAGEDPSAIVLTNNRFARTNVRVVLRQLKASGQALPALPAWIRAHEQAVQAEMDEDPHGRG